MLQATSDKALPGALDRMAGVLPRSLTHTPQIEEVGGRCPWIELCVEGLASCVDRRRNSSTLYDLATCALYKPKGAD